MAIIPLDLFDLVRLLPLSHQLFQRFNPKITRISHHVGLHRFKIGIAIASEVFAGGDDQPQTTLWQLNNHEITERSAHATRGFANDGSQTRILHQGTKTAGG